MFEKFLFLLFLSVSFRLYAQPIIPDISFDADGFAFSKDSTIFNDLVVLPDGKIICGGHKGFLPFGNFLSKFTSNGSPDSSFGSAGIAVFPPIGTLNTRTAKIALQADGKIISSGTVYDLSVRFMGFFLTRNNTDGKPDSSFNGTGILIDTIPLNILMNTNVDGEARNLVIQNDGKIIQCKSTIGLSPFYYTTRYNTDGSVDSTYGLNGSVTIHVNPEPPIDLARSIALQADGKIVLAGTTHSYDPQESNTAFIRLNNNGSIDSSFGINGVAIINASANTMEYPSRVMIQPDGKIVACGVVNGSEFLAKGVVIRLNSDGTPDITFGTNGVSSLVNYGFKSWLEDMSLENDGSVICTGYTYPQKPMMVKFRSNGSVADNFGVNGFVITDIPDAISGESYSIEFFGERIITCGIAYNSINGKGMVAVYKRVNSTVPLSLLTFYGLQQQGDNKLFWQEATQPDVVLYVVQKSTDAVNFIKMGSVDASVNLAYSFTDKVNKAGTCYYRLQIIHIDGSVTYSNIIRFINNAVLASIYPNPVTNNLNLVLNTKEKNALIKIADAKGSIVKEMKLTVTGNSAVPLNTGNLPKGTYFVLVYAAGEMLRLPFIKQ